MSKINKEIAIFIVFLTLVALWGLFVKVPVEDTKTPDPESKVGGMAIQFKDGISEPEAKAILQNYNMTRNYRITYDNSSEKYYIMADKDNWSDIRHELVKEMKENKKDWTISSPAHVIKKRDYYVLPVSEQAIQDEKFLAIMDKYDIGVKKFIWCGIRFLYSDGPLTYWIPEENAIEIKNELEQNENIFTVQLSYLYP
jgi:phosphoribosylformylglycinamidine (FGAM) synthase PurS component